MSTVQADIIRIELPGGSLQEGFWLYVWDVTLPTKARVYYVGRTGDSSSIGASPPYRRFGQHLGFGPTTNALRSHLIRRGVQPEQCLGFEFIAYGPLFEKQVDKASHKIPRDKIAALEKMLADSLGAAGYDVMNTVKSKMPLDDEMWSQIRDAFQPHFPRLRESTL